MKTMMVIFVAVSLALLPYTVSANAQSSTSQRPPIEQPLVSEGEFAVELATALNLTSSHDEAAAENSLAAINIAPRNGWISDYPMTPDIVAEVRESTARATSAGSLNMSEADAASAVDGVSTAMGLPIKVAGESYNYESSSSSSSEYAESPAVPPEVSQYEEPSDVEQYYDENGPPVVSYYPPPWEYGYLYDWVPYPFWWDGFGFGGFFILGDFDFDGHGHHHHHGEHNVNGDHRITNHVSNANGTVRRINPVTRATAATASSRLAGANRTGQGSRFNSADSQARAKAIMNRLAQTRTGNTANTSGSRNLASSGSSRNMDRSGSTSRTFNSGSASRSPSFAGRSFGRAPSTRSFSGGGFHGGGGFGGGGGHGGGGHR